MARPRPRPDPEPELPPLPLVPTPTSQFKKDAKRQGKRGKDGEKLRAVIATLSAREPLAPRFADHQLSGDWSGWRECHVEPDWLLIYRATDTELILGRTGSHADLFG